MSDIQTDPIDKIDFIANISCNINIPSDVLFSSNIYSIIKQLVIKTYEKKCGPYGYIDKIYKLTEYKDNVAVSEELNNNILFNVTFTAKIYNPIKDHIILCTITNINKYLITCVNGPLKIIININHINHINFKLTNNQLYHIGTEKMLDINDQLYVKIIDSNFYNNDDKIFVYAILQNIKNN